MKSTSYFVKFLMTVLLMMAGKAHASFAYVPFIDLVNEAEFIIQGEIINKTYKKETRERNLLIFNEDGTVDKIPQWKKGIYTDYQLQIKEAYKGDINQDIIIVEASGGCDVDVDINMCFSDSTGYGFQTGQQVVIFLKYDKNYQVYKSTNGGLTTYFINDDGIIYRQPEELEILKRGNYESFDGETPFHVDDLKKVFRIHKKRHKKKP